MEYRLYLQGSHLPLWPEGKWLSRHLGGGKILRCVKLNLFEYVRYLAETKCCIRHIVTACYVREVRLALMSNTEN